MSSKISSSIETVMLALSRFNVAMELHGGKGGYEQPDKPEYGRS